MVLFGENLLTLQTPGWESQYIKYAELKVTIAKIKNATDEDAKAQLSTDFYTSLIKQVVKVNTFVQKQQQLAGVAFGKAGDAETLLAGAPLLQSESRSLSDAIAQTGDDAKVNKYLCALKDVSDTLTDIRHFVGTNVIAATKIVKKHDKNVPDALAKRSIVSETICKQPFYVDSTLPQLASEVDVAIAKALAKLYTGKDLASTELLSAGAAGSGTDTDDAGEGHQARCSAEVEGIKRSTGQRHGIRLSGARRSSAGRPSGACGAARDYRRPVATTQRQLRLEALASVSGGVREARA